MAVVICICEKASNLTTDFNQWWIFLKTSFILVARQQITWCICKLSGQTCCCDRFPALGEFGHLFQVLYQLVCVDVLLCTKHHNNTSTSLAQWRHNGSSCQASSHSSRSALYPSYTLWLSCKSYQIWAIVRVLVAGNRKYLEIVWSHMQLSCNGCCLLSRLLLHSGLEITTLSLARPTISKYLVFSAPMNFIRFTQ